MERDDLHRPGTPGSDDALADALLAPGEGSFVDALLVLADAAANASGPDGARAAMSHGFQAALARRMRRSIGSERSAA